MVGSIFKVCKRQHVPLYSSRFSRRDFHPVAAHRPGRADAEGQEVVSGEYADDYLTTTERLLDVLGLSRIPRFATVEEFLLRVPGTLLEEGDGRIHPSHENQGARSSVLIRPASPRTTPPTTTPSESRGTYIILSSSSMRSQVGLKERSER